MVEDATKYCGDFYSKFLPSINDNINLIKDNITNNLENLMKESAIESIIGNMFMEADEEKKESDDAPKEYQSMDKAAKADGKKEEENPADSGNDSSSSDSSQQSGGDTSQTSGTTASDASSSSSSDTSSSTPSSTSSSSDTSKSSTPVEDAKTVSDTAKKVEMLQRMVQQFCNGILTAAFDRYKDYMNLLKGLAGEGTEQINSSTDKAEETPQEEPSSEGNGDTGNEGNAPETNNNTEENQEASGGNETEAQPEETSQEQQPAEQDNAGAAEDSDSVDETGLYS